MTREKLLKEGVLSKFLRYTTYDTQADAESSSVPSSQGQRLFAEALVEELKCIGLEDASIVEGFTVVATYQGDVKDCPAIGFMAHMDTAPGAPGSSVKAIVHKNYDGGDIILPSGSLLSPSTCPELSKAKGHTLVTSDGRTLLGADDKAGIAEIMEALCRLQESGSPKCGRIRVAFTSDEEIGKGIEGFSVEDFGVKAAYTLDGGIVGEIEDETFNAENLRIRIRGRSAHPGRARGAMINALNIASQLIASIPADKRPETTDERLGFIHPSSISGDVEEVVLNVIVRDFEEKAMRDMLAGLEAVCSGLARLYPGSTVEIERARSYRNMKPFLQKEPRVVLLAQKAVRMAGLDPVLRSIRGGTDGAHLSALGLPTPNIFTGGACFHSRIEWVSVEWMEKAVEVILNIAGLWASQGEVINR
jgi:tripeptide aminopeptidase